MSEKSGANRKSRLWRSKAFRAVVLSVTLTLGTVVAIESPALAVGACNHDFAPLGPCIDYQGGTDVRADFYLNVNPSSTYHAYRVGIVSNGNVQWKTGKVNFTVKGRYCCWTRGVNSEPDSWHTVLTRVEIYNAGGSRINSVDSPSIQVFD
jgi:hypothetical protein